MMQEKHLTYVTVVKAYMTNDKEPHIWKLQFMCFTVVLTVHGEATNSQQQMQVTKQTCSVED
jgi:hypothetical protein